MITSEQREAYKEHLKENKKTAKIAMKRFKKSYLIWVLVGMVIGIGLVVISKMLEVKGTMNTDSFGKYLLIGFVLYFVFIIVNVIIHEAGHLIFGLMSGYRFLSFRIFSLTFVKKDGKIQRKKFKIKGTAGQCLMYPPKRSEDGSFPFVLYNLGGGIANLLACIPFIILAIFIDGAIARTIFISFTISGLILGLSNIIPMDMGLQNDGMNIASMLKDEYIREGFYLQLQINAQMSEGKEITDYDIETFEIPEGANDTNMLTVSNHFFSYYWYLVKKDYESAYNVLMKMTEKLGEYSLATFNMIQAERLFFMILHDRPTCEIAALYYRTRYTLVAAKTDVGIQRIRYVYEALLTEDKKKDIMSLIKKKVLKKWKPTDLDKLYKEISKTAENFPVVGEAKMHMDILNNCVF